MSISISDRAAFATSARLISCLVTESLSTALYYPGYCVLQDILIVVFLIHTPILKNDTEIGLLDPMDISPGMIFETESTTDLSSLKRCIDPLRIWSRFAASYKVDSDMIKQINDELESSVLWQNYSYQNPPKTPTFSSPSIEWEQSIVEGHPTHPMHKTRLFLPPIPPISPGSYDLYNPKLRFVALPKSNLNITYDFERLTEPLRAALGKSTGNAVEVPDGHLLIPVHELQVSHIQDKFKDEAVVYPPEYNLPLLAQQSIRSVIVPNVYKNLSLKLGVGIKLTSAIRTISPASAYLGPRFSSSVIPSLAIDPEILTVAKELASVVHTHPDPEIAKHCSAIVREAHELDSESRGERLIVCTALVESGHQGQGGDIPAVVRVFELTTTSKKIDWLDRYINIFFKAFLPTILINGVAFEAHPQNCVARFSLDTKVLKGFIVRDFGGIRVHKPTLLSSTGIELDVVEGHSIIAPDLDDVYARMYHTVIHNHLQQLIRVLGLHYCGRGWELVRKNLREVVPPDSGLYKAWMDEEKKTFPGKCFLRMRMQGMYRFHLHSPFPNLIHYKGVDKQ